MANVDISCWHGNIQYNNITHVVGVYWDRRCFVGTRFKIGTQGFLYVLVAPASHSVRVTQIDCWA